MNPLRSERDAFRALLLLIAGAVGVAAAGTLGDGWTALATFLALVAGISVGIWIGRQAADASAASAPREPVPGLPVLVVAPVELAGSSLARELATEEEATSVRAVLLRPDEGEGDPTSRPAAELRALLEGVRRGRAGDLGCAERRGEGRCRGAARRRAEPRVHRDASARAPGLRSRGTASARDRPRLGGPGCRRCVRRHVAPVRLRPGCGSAFYPGGAGTASHRARPAAASGSMSFAFKNARPAQVAT